MTQVQSNMNSPSEIKQYTEYDTFNFGKVKVCKKKSSRWKPVHGETMVTIVGCNTRQFIKNYEFILPVKKKPLTPAERKRISRQKEASKQLEPFSVVLSPMAAKELRGRSASLPGTYSDVVEGLLIPEINTLPCESKKPLDEIIVPFDYFKKPYARVVAELGKDIKKTERNLLLYLARKPFRSGMKCPKQKEISVGISISIAQVKRVIASLVKKGFIKVDKPSLTDRHLNYMGNTYYFLNHPAYAGYERK